MRSDSLPEQSKLHAMSADTKNPLFVPVYRKYEPNTGKEVIYYVPNFELVDRITIKAINLNTGQVIDDEVVFLTKHTGIRMFKVSLRKDVTYRDEPIFRMLTTHEDEESLYVSDDHSLIVYDALSDKLSYMAPWSLTSKTKEHKNRYFLLQHIDGIRFEYFRRKYRNVFDRLFSLFEQKGFGRLLLQRNILPIPAEHIEFKYDESKTEAYDFTTARTKTFSLSNGLFVMDTIVVFSLHTEEAKKEAWEKMRFSQQLYTITNADSVIADLGKNPAYGWYYATMDTKVLGKKQQKHLNKGKVYKDLLELKEDFRKAGDQYSLHDIVTIEDVDGNICDVEIGKAFLVLAVKKVITE